MALNTELTMLKNLYEEDVAPYFNSPSNSDGIGKASYCPDQIRQYNSRTMVANFKQMINACFFKRQFHTVRSFAESFLPDDMEDQDKNKRANNMTKFMCSQINGLVFSASYSNDIRLADANDGQLPSTSASWGEILNFPISDQQTIDQQVNDDESDYDEEATDAELDENSTSRPKRKRITLGQRWCQQNIPTAQMRQYIKSHRRALGVLLVVRGDADRRSRQLRPKHLKKANYLLKSKLRYFEFLRYQNSVHNNKRFQVFPEYKMTTKHFKLDPTILKALKMTSISVDRESGKSSLNRGKRKRLDRNLYPDMPLAPENPWLELFDLQTFGVDEHTSLSMTTDGFGVCISIGDENEQDIEEEGDEEEGGEEEGDEEDDGDYGDEEGTEQDGEENVDADEEFIDIRNFDHGLFRLEKLNALPLAWTLREVDYIGVDPGLKSVVTAVRSDDLNDKLEISSGAHWQQAAYD